MTAMPKRDRAHISQAVLNRLLDVMIDFVQENIELKKGEPVAWRWYDDMNERWEFALRKENLPPNAEPLYVHDAGRDKEDRR